MFNFKLICIVILLLSLHEIKSEISDKKLCANENCTEPISLAKTVLRYSSPDRRILSFAANVDATIYSKSAGSNMDLWGVEIKGKKGYAPKKFLRETRIFTKELPFLVNTELKDDQQVPSINSVVHETVKANKVPEYDVIDGTTIYLTSEESISPTPSETTIKPTVTSQNTEGNDVLDVKTDEINNKEISQSMEENNILDDEASEINNKETEPLILTKSVDKDDKPKSNEIVDADDQVEHKSKKTLVGNVIQSITDWMSDKEKDEFVAIDFEEENEEDDEDDDYEDVDDETDSEESEEVKDSDTQVVDEKTSDTVDGNEKDTNDDTNKPEGNLSESSLQKINEETIPSNIDTEETLNLKEVNDENSVVKTRQLLSEKETSDDISTNQVNKDNKETTQNEETKNTEVKQDSDSDNASNVDLNVKEANENTTVDSKQCSDDNCLKGSENDFKTTTSEQETSESVTESVHTEIPGLEIPMPQINDFVTPNPIENDQSSSIDPNNNILKEKEKVSQNIVLVDEAVVTEQNTNLVAPENETVENLEIQNSDSDKNEEDKEDVSVENAINLQSGSSSETSDISVSKKESNLPAVSEIEIKPVEEESSNSSEGEVTTAPNIEGLPESEKLNSVSENLPEEMTVSSEDKENKQTSAEINQQENSETVKNNEETKFNFLSDITNWLGDQHNENTENSAEINRQQENSQTLKSDDETNSYILSDITNWLANQQNEQAVELASESDLSQNNTNENVKQESEELKQEVLESESMEANEKHEHSFLSMINEVQENVIENLLSETSEITKEADTDITKDQIISAEELSKEEDTRETSHVFDVHDQVFSKNSNDYGSCPAGESDCPADISVIQKQLEMEEVSNSLNLDFSDFLNLLTVLGVTGLSVVIFLLGYITIDKNRKEGPLIAKINNLEKALLVTAKENTLLIDRVSEIQNETAVENERISSEEFDNLNRTYQETLATKSILEDQVQSLEKELENSTEVGLELNRLLSDILSSQNGSEILIANVEQLQRQLIEQQGTINSINDTLNLKDTENHELQLELEIKNKKVTHLQTELDKMALNLFKVEEDKEQMQAKLENEIIELKDQFEKSKNSFNSTRTKLVDEINALKGKCSETQRNLEVKTNEYSILKENFNQIKTIKNNTEALESLLNASSTKAELQQLQRENLALNDLVRQEQQTKFTLEKQIEIALQEARSYKAKYDDSDKEKLEAQTKLEVLSNYFKEREGQLQKELSKQESMWVEQRGEATSTTERIKYMQEELQNCKSQNELLKQEIISQEVELKSQISVLEKKAHENWVSARQAERRLEDAKQEAAQLRNKLTLKERSFMEDKSQNRIQSPLEQNGDVAVSPLHMAVDSPASPPLLYGTRDHLTTSPPLPNLPPFLPPPPGVPFMPPPIPGVPGFMPPPPSMFPVDHRPPPLGRMSSMPPPLNSRYSPDSRYSPYDRNSPSPPYDDEYGSSPPPMHRGYSPYDNRDDRRDYKRPLPPVRTNGRKKGAMSSGSGNSNESLEKINRHHSKV